MVAIYILLWAFYRVAARLCKAPRYVLVCEVVNPSKDHELADSPYFIYFRYFMLPKMFSGTTVSWRGSIHS